MPVFNLFNWGEVKTPQHGHYSACGLYDMTLDTYKIFNNNIFNSNHNDDNVILFIIIILNWFFNLHLTDPPALWNSKPGLSQ